MKQSPGHFGQTKQEYIFIFKISRRKKKCTKQNPSNLQAYYLLVKENFQVAIPPYPPTVPPASTFLFLVTHRVFRQHYLIWNEQTCSSPPIILGTIWTLLNPIKKKNLLEEKVWCLKIQIELFRIPDIFKDAIVSEEYEAFWLFYTKWKCLMKAIFFQWSLKLRYFVNGRMTPSWGLFKNFRCCTNGIGLL